MSNQEEHRTLPYDETEQEADGEIWTVNQGSGGKGDVFLEHFKYPYQIDLPDATTSAAVLDWIIQLIHKDWVGPESIYEFIEKVDKFLHLQANYCSGGFESNPDRTAEEVKRLISARRTP